MQGATISSGGWSPLSALRRSDADVAASMLRLATGKRINRAADRPADMVTIESLKADSSDLSEQIDSLDRENSRLSAQDGAMSVVDDLVTDLQGLTVSAANTRAQTGAEREANQQQVDSLIQTISFLAGSTTYDGEHILDGIDPAKMGLTDGPSPVGDTAAYSLADLATGGRLTLYGGDPALAAKAAQSAAEGVWNGRASAGAEMKQNESRVRALMNQREGGESVRSLLEDTDTAAEVARLVRARTMQQAALYAAALSRHQGGTVLRLLEATR